MDEFREIKFLLVGLLRNVVFQNKFNSNHVEENASGKNTQKKTSKITF